jgi:uncharacterized membrane protein
MGAADEAVKRMAEAKKTGTFYYDDAAVIRRDSKGKVHARETGDMSTGKGAAIGALVGGVIGLLGGPGGAAIGAGAGAAIGGLGSLRDSGFSNESLKELGSALPPRTSAIAATTSSMFVEQVRKQAEEGATLSAAKEIASDIRAKLEAGQDVLYSLVITEEGVAASQVVASPSAVAVFGIAADESGVVAGQAVVTKEGVAYEVAAADAEGGVIVDAAASADEVESAESDDK